MACCEIGPGRRESFLESTVIVRRLLWFGSRPGGPGVLQRIRLVWLIAHCILVLSGTPRTNVLGPMDGLSMGDRNSHGVDLSGSATKSTPRGGSVLVLPRKV